MTQDPGQENKAPTSPPTRVLITGGGTGGHVYPGLAVAEVLQEMEPGVSIRFAGTSRGIESVLVPRAGYDFVLVPASGFRGLSGRARLLFLWNFLRGWLRSVFMMISWRPHVVLGTGGYVSAPVMAAARTLGIPCALQEQNAIPGSTNRLVGRWARRIYLGFGAAARYFGEGKSLETGNPVRAAFLEGTATGEPRSGGGAHRILIFGGSRGAASLNAAVIAAAPDWRDRDDLTLVVQTGAGRTVEVEEAFAGAPQGRVEVKAFIEDMPAVLGWADLVVCRSGAMTLAELHCAGKPAVLVPFPHATDDHQLKNAADCAAAGAARVLTDDRCDGATLVAVVDELLADPEALAGMSRAARGLARPHAARTIAADLLQLLGRKPRGTAPETPKDPSHVS